MTSTDGSRLFVNETNIDWTWLSGKREMPNVVCEGTDFHIWREDLTNIDKKVKNFKCISCGAKLHKARGMQS